MKSIWKGYSLKRWSQTLFGTYFAGNKIQVSSSKIHRENQQYSSTSLQYKTHHLLKKILHLKRDKGDRKRSKLIDIQLQEQQFKHQTQLSQMLTAGMPICIFPLSTWTMGQPVKQNGLKCKVVSKVLNCRHHHLMQPQYCGCGYCRNHINPQFRCGPKLHESSTTKRWHSCIGTVDTINFMLQQPQSTSQQPQCPQSQLPQLLPQWWLQPQFKIMPVS